jgi:hypothetical protein
VVTDLGHEEPTFVLTNQLRRSAVHLVGRYAQRMLGKISIETVPPQLSACVRVDQLSGYTDPWICAANAAFYDIGHAKFGSNGAHVLSGEWSPPTKASHLCCTTA